MVNYLALISKADAQRNVRYRGAPSTGVDVLPQPYDVVPWLMAAARCAAHPDPQRRNAGQTGQGWGPRAGSGRAQPRGIGRAVRARACSIVASSTTSRLGSPNTATVTMTSGRCRNMWSVSFVATSIVASSPAFRPGPLRAMRPRLPDRLLVQGQGRVPLVQRRRMVATAAHLTDHVLPPLPVRQWVLACPSACATSCTATAISRVRLCACSCGRWSNACVRGNPFHLKRARQRRRCRAYVGGYCCGPRGEVGNPESPASRLSARFRLAPHCARDYGRDGHRGVRIGPEIIRNQSRIERSR